MAVTLNRQPYGETTDGQAVERFRFSNGRATSVDIISFGAIITSWRCADHRGDVEDIVLGYDTLADYEVCRISMGCIIGRYANRIANGRFTLDGKTYALEKNHYGHHLHGGTGGFHKVVWRAHVERSDTPVLVLQHRSADGASGYPGTLEVEVRYCLSEDNALSIDYSATSDAATVLNMTSHSYFNLQGARYAQTSRVLGHQLQINAQQVLQTDNKGIPTGEKLNVAGSGFDFTSLKYIAEQIAQLRGRGYSGYDHCYVSGCGASQARLHSPETGRWLEVSSSMPGLQVYTAGHVNDFAGRAGAVYGSEGSICLEAQYFPDSPNHPEFPSTELRPGQRWCERTVYKVLVGG